MQIDVSDILRKGEGAQTEFTVSDEQPQLDDVILTAPLSGTVRIIGTKTGILAAGRLEGEVEVECHRCLQAFSHPVHFPFEAEFDASPQDDQLPIDRYGKIDLAEPIRQEIVVHLPLQQLCQDGCNGIELNQKKDSNGSS
jgi:uncharacterized protein